MRLPDARRGFMREAAGLTGTLAPFDAGHSRYSASASII